jgi:hypothetical protein
MSLDVYLTLPGAPPRETSGIFVRESGSVRELTREEWDERYPGREPVVATIPETDEPTEVFSANITHNLNSMAGAAGIYEHLWRPDEIGITKAGQLIEPLRAGLAMLQAEPDRFKALNPANGWGDYDGLVRFVANYLAACEESPDAEVRVSR